MNNIKAGKEAQEAVIKGFNIVADAVKGTLGAAGYNGLIERSLYPFSETTNDGVSIAKAIVLDDPWENMGANLAKEIADRADKQSRDGTTTALTLAQAILKEGLNADISPMQLKRELEACIPIIESAIDAQKKDITIDEVGKVATVSAEDEGIGALIQEIYQKIGPNGIIFRDISKTFTDHYEIGQGIQIEDCGFASPYMADIDDKTNQPLNAARLKNPKVLITKQKLTTGVELENIASFLASQGASGLVIFADDFDIGAVTNLVMTRIQRGFPLVLVKMPVLWKDQWFEDIAKMTGATTIDPAAGITFKDITIKHLGMCGHIEVFKDQVFIDGIADLSDHIKALEEAGDDDSLIRAARLNKKTARLFVGAPTEQALSYRRLKVEDAVGSAWQALHGGIVAGGGVALKNVSENLPDTVGGKILKQGLLAPLRQIAENGRYQPFSDELDTPNKGLNAKTGEMVDMFEANIVDPANVVKNSARNAISVAAVLLTAQVAVTLPRVHNQFANDGKPVIM